MTGFCGNFDDKNWAAAPRWLEKTLVVSSPTQILMPFLICYPRPQTQEHETHATYRDTFYLTGEIIMATLAPPLGVPTPGQVCQLESSLQPMAGVAREGRQRPSQLHLTIPEPPGP